MFDILTEILHYVWISHTNSLLLQNFFILRNFCLWLDTWHVICNPFVCHQTSSTWRIFSFLRHLFFHKHFVLLYKKIWITVVPILFTSVMWNLYPMLFYEQLLILRENYTVLFLKHFKQHIKRSNQTDIHMNTYDQVHACACKTCHKYLLTSYNYITHWFQ